MTESLLGVYGVYSAFLFILSGFIFFKITPDMVKKSEYYIFRTFIIAFLFYLAMNILWSLQEFEVLHMSRALFTTVCFFSYVSVVANAFCFYAFTMVHFNFDLGKNMLATILGLLPMCLAIILLGVSLKTGMIFSITEDAHLVTGKAYLALPACAFLYFAVIARVSLMRAFTNKSRPAKKEGFILAGCVVFLVVWVLLDGLFEKITIIPIAIYSVINFLFVQLLSSKVYTDALTDMNNRRKSEEHLSAQLESVSESAPMYLFIADVNSFKFINDNYGHLEGDRALVIVSNAIKKVVAGHLGFAARYGGDEFIWAKSIQKDASFDPEGIIREIHAEIDALCAEKEKPYSLSLSVGYVRCVDPKKKLSSYIDEADEHLYKNKKSYHNETASNPS